MSFLLVGVSGAFAFYTNAIKWFSFVTVRITSRESRCMDRAGDMDIDEALVL